MNRMGRDLRVGMRPGRRQAESPSTADGWDGPRWRIPEGGRERTSNAERPTLNVEGKAGRRSEGGRERTSNAKRPTLNVDGKAGMNRQVRQGDGGLPARHEARSHQAVICANPVRLSHAQIFQNVGPSRSARLRLTGCSGPVSKSDGDPKCYSTRI